MPKKMLNDLEQLYAKCFPDRKQKWTADDFADLQKSGCEIIMSENSFIVYRIAADEAEIITIGVDPKIRRTGTAFSLMTIVEKEIKNQGVNNIFLEVSSTNIPAIELYKKLGFLPVGSRPKYYEDGTDAIVMKKQICD